MKRGRNETKKVEGDENGGGDEKKGGQEAAKKHVAVICCTHSTLLCCHLRSLSSLHIVCLPYVLYVFLARCMSSLYAVRLPLRYMSRFAIPLRYMSACCHLRYVLPLTISASVVYL